MKVKGTIQLNREKLIEEIYLDTGLSHIEIDEVLRSIEKHLYNLDIIEYD